MYEERQEKRCPDKTSGDKTSGDKTSVDKTSLGTRTKRPWGQNVRRTKRPADKTSVGTKRPWGQNVRLGHIYQGLARQYFLLIKIY